MAKRLWPELSGDSVSNFSLCCNKAADKSKRKEGLFWLTVSEYREQGNWSFCIHLTRK